jgi:hypothetical protein
MRLGAYGEIERTWLVDALGGDTPQSGLKDYLSGQPSAPRRRILFIRLPQTFNELLGTIPRWRLCELARRSAKELPDPLPPINDLLPFCGVDLGRALEIYEHMGGSDRVADLNRVSTSFTALSSRDIESLYDQARWQVHAGSALYWD